jgi:hypothetical protein
MKKKDVTSVVDAIQEWKELGIVLCKMDFSCGGDSMNDWSFRFNNKDDEEVESDFLKNFFEEEVFKRVEFYVNSDGHYLGEAGTVEITLDEEEENPEFKYDKISQSEWSENHSESCEIEVSPEEYEFLKNKISTMFGEGWDSDVDVVYKADCILSDKELEMLDQLEEKFSNASDAYDFKEVPDDYETTDSSSNTWEFDSSSEDCLKDGKVFVTVTGSFYVFKDEINNEPI